MLLFFIFHYDLYRLLAVFSTFDNNLDRFFCFSWNKQKSHISLNFYNSCSIYYHCYFITKKNSVDFKFCCFISWFLNHIEVHSSRISNCFVIYSGYDWWLMNICESCFGILKTYTSYCRWCQYLLGLFQIRFFLETIWIKRERKKWIPFFFLEFNRWISRFFLSPVCVK